MGSSTSHRERKAHRHSCVMRALPFPAALPTLLRRPLPPNTHTFIPFPPHPGSPTPTPPLLHHLLQGNAVNPTNLVVLAGAGAIIENLFWCIGEAGQCVLIPRPYYPAFDNDLQVWGAFVWGKCGAGVSDELAMQGSVSSSPAPTTRPSTMNCRCGVQLCGG